MQDDKEKNENASSKDPESKQESNPKKNIPKANPPKFSLGKGSKPLPPPVKPNTLNRRGGGGRGK